MDGEYTYIDSAGTLRERSNYVHGKLHGLYEDWYANGQLWERSFYINNDLDGEYLLYHENGQLKSRGYYANTREHGHFQTWDKDGRLLTDDFYVNGECNSESLVWLEAEHRYERRFFKNDVNITYSVGCFVADINNITEEEALMIALKFGITML